MDDSENVVVGAGQQQRTGGAGSTTDGSLGSDLTEMVEMKVTVREKMKRIRGFKKFVEKSGELVEQLQSALGDTALNARKQVLIVAPVEKYCVELRERFEEVRCDGWQKQVLKWMKEKTVDTVEELREECEKVGQMKTRIRVRGIAADVIFQIVENKGNMFLLGTNAFASMGAELSWEAKKSPTSGCAKEHSGKMMATEEKENHVVNVISLDKKQEVKRVEPREMKKEKNGALDNANSDRKAESLKKEVMLRSQPQKPIIQEKYVLVGQRMGLRSKAVFEVRTSAIPTWKQKFRWEKVEKAVLLVEWAQKEKELKALVNLVEEIAKEVREVVVVPAKMECGFDEVQEVTDQWKKVAHITVVNPMMPVGTRKTPLIRSELKPRSLEQAVEYLELAIPGHPLVDRLRAEVEETEPQAKKHRGN